MTYDIFQRIYEWNKGRNNLHYSKLHEGNMLDEEVVEYLESYSDANELKELADIIFVAVGSMVKKVGVEKARAVMDIVINHNSKKANKKVNGKVTKEGSVGKAEDEIKESLKSYYNRNEHIYKLKED